MNAHRHPPAPDNISASQHSSAGIRIAQRLRVRLQSQDPGSILPGDSSLKVVLQKFLIFCIIILWLYVQK